MHCETCKRLEHNKRSCARRNQENVDENVDENVEENVKVPLANVEEPDVEVPATNVYDDQPHGLEPSVHEDQRLPHSQPNAPLGTQESNNFSVRYTRSQPVDSSTGKSMKKVAIKTKARIHLSPKQV